MALYLIILKTFNAARCKGHLGLAQNHEFKYVEISPAIAKDVQFTVIHQQNSRSHDQCRKYTVIGSNYFDPKSLRRQHCNFYENDKFHSNPICVIVICSYLP